jgi:hypothetical protein
MYVHSLCIQQLLQQSSERRGALPMFRVGMGGNTGGGAVVLLPIPGPGCWILNFNWPLLCVCVCVYIYMYVRVYICVCACVCIYIYVRTCIYICVCACVCVFGHMYTDLPLSQNSTCAVSSGREICVRWSVCIPYVLVRSYHARVKYLSSYCKLF